MIRAENALERLGVVAVLVSVVTLWSCGVAKEQPSPGTSVIAGLQLRSVNPSYTMAGQAFLPQPDGTSAIMVAGTGFVPTSKVRFNDRVLATAFGGEGMLSATVAQEVYEKEVVIRVTVQNVGGEISNALVFQVVGASGGAPVLKKLAPEEAQVGVPFLPQPGGYSALVLQGERFRPGVAAVFNGTKLTTAFGGPTVATAVVPAELLRTPGTASIHVVNSDGSRSEVVKFVIRAAK